MGEAMRICQQSGYERGCRNTTTSGRPASVRPHTVSTGSPWRVVAGRGQRRGENNTSITSQVAISKC